jgi:urea transport system ATP-binding protein
MLLMQDPELLLVDEPVAGMTDQETEHTAALLRRIAGGAAWWWWSTTSSSSGRWAAASPVLHEGSVLSEAASTTCRTTRAWSKCTWGALRHVAARRSP